MSMQEEIVLGPEFKAPIRKMAEDPALVERIRALVNQERFAVLCTQGHGQPYGSLVAFACSQDLRSFVFATSVATRKFELLSECDRVALVIDNRDRFPDELMKVGAITATGRARRVEPGPEFDRWSHLLTNRHPYLKCFVAAPSTALFRVSIIR